MKSQAGHLAKAGVEAGELLKEFPVPAEQLASLKLAKRSASKPLPSASWSTSRGTTKGRGFSGVIRRHHFSSNRASHGNSRSHNRPGSISMAQDPGRVFPGKRIAGQYGNVMRTVQTLKVIRVDVARGLLLVKGCGSRRRRRPHRRPAFGQDPGEEGGLTMDLKLINDRGKPAATLAASDALFAREYNEALIHQLVTAYQANARSGNRAQKGRADINKSHKKPWAQKGTGRARAGQANSPLGAAAARSSRSSPDENFSQKVNRKMFRAGIAAILSQLVREDRLSVVEQFALDAPKTKLFAQRSRDSA